jgi:tellurite resistance protein TerC
MDTQTWAWILFNAIVLGMLALDLVVFHRRPHSLGMKEALGWVAVWVSLAAAFAVFVYYWRGSESALQFVTAYLIEESLSVDNMFVFLVIFSYFAVPREYEHRVLFWGILGALVMRGALIFAGVALIQRFHWIIYLFGAFLIVTGLKLAFQKEEAVDPGKNPILRLTRRLVPLTDKFAGSRFFIKSGGKYLATPLFVVLVVVETTDLVFALDSIPAVLAISHDPFIVYTSNVFAILGLRAMFFALAGAMESFHYLRYGLAGVLSFVGCKMVIAEFYKIPIGVALGVVGGILALTVVLSLLKPRPKPVVSEGAKNVSRFESAAAVEEEV